jgi:hypothetical protein
MRFIRNYNKTVNAYPLALRGRKTTHIICYMIRRYSALVMGAGSVAGVTESSTAETVVLL